MFILEKIRRLLWYCEMFTARHVRFIIGFSELDWIKICTNLKEEYKDRDIVQQISFRAYLKAFKDKPKTENTERFHFHRNYSEIFKELLGKRKLDWYTQLKWFIPDLLSSIQSKLINKYDIELDRNALSDIADMLKKAYSLIETRKKMTVLGTTDVINDRISDLVDRSAKNDQLKHLFSGSSKHSDSIFQVSIVSTVPIISATPSQNDKKIDLFTCMMQSLILSVCTLQSNLGIPPIISQPRAKPANTSPESRICTDYQGANANENWPKGDNKCIDCWEIDHYLKRDCQIFQDNLNLNRIHLGDEGKVCLGPYLPGVRPVYMRREKPNRKFLADVEKLQYPSRLSANV